MTMSDEGEEGWVGVVTNNKILIAFAFEAAPCDLVAGTEHCCIIKF